MGSSGEKKKKKKKLCRENICRDFDQFVILQCLNCVVAVTRFLRGRETKETRDGAEQMAFVNNVKHHRRQERWMTASSALILTCAVVVGFVLVAVWVSSSSSSVATEREGEKEEMVLVLDSKSGGAGGDNAALLVGAADVSRVWNSEEAGTGGGGGENDKREDDDDGEIQGDGRDRWEADAMAGGDAILQHVGEQFTDKELSEAEEGSEDKKTDINRSFKLSYDLPTANEKSELVNEGNEDEGGWSSQAEFETKPTTTALVKEEEEEEDEEEGSSSADSGSEELSAADSETETATSEQSKSSTRQDLQEEEEEEVVANDGSRAREESWDRKWKSCAWIGAQNYIPCLGNRKYLSHNKDHKHFEHRERHCPLEAEQPKCLIPLPLGYRVPILWPQSRDQIWYDNVPHQKLVSFTTDQNWMKKFENKLMFSGGDTQFKDGAQQYINFIQRVYPDIEWGKNIRVVLDVGCGVASFGGYLFDRDVITMSFAPKDDEHEAQVQLALERGIPALLSVMDTQCLVFPSNVFDIVHCAHCWVHRHGDGGMLFLELNRVLRPGGYFVWSATPVYQNTPADREAWNQTIVVTESMCWKLVAKHYSNEAAIGVAIFQKPKDNDVYETSRVAITLPFCSEADADAAWHVKMTHCIHRIPDSAHSKWPAQWPARLKATPASNLETGIYGKPAPEDYHTDTEHWEHVVQKLYLQGLGINWTTIHNIMDMKASYGGFAAALIKQPLWVMNIIPISEPDTLPIIYDRGLIGMYHDWCEPHSTYPRTYDLLHANHIISSITNKCNLLSLVMEMDRILRPDGWAIFRDQMELLIKVEDIVKSMHWDIMFTYKDDNSEQLLAVKKSFWRPNASL